MSEQFEKQEPTDIQGLKAVKTTNHNQPLGIEIEQIVGDRCTQSGFLAKDQREWGCPCDPLLLQGAGTREQGDECIRDPGWHQLTCTPFAENSTMHQAEAAKCMKNSS